MASHDLNIVRWKRLRVVVLKRDKYLDQLALRYGRRIEANTVHHIFPREVFPELTYEPWNLISVSTATHNELHIRNSHRLTSKGWELLMRTARAQGIEIKQGLKDILT